MDHGLDLDQSKGTPGGQNGRSPMGFRCAGTQDTHDIRTDCPGCEPKGGRVATPCRGCRCLLARIPVQGGEPTFESHFWPAGTRCPGRYLRRAGCSRCRPPLQFGRSPCGRGVFWNVAGAQGHRSGPKPRQRHAQRNAHPQRAPRTLHFRWRANRANAERPAPGRRYWRIPDQ